MVTYLSSVHTITEAKQYAGLGRAEPGERGERDFLAIIPMTLVTLARILHVHASGHCPGQ